MVEESCEGSVDDLHVVQYSMLTKRVEEIFAATNCNVEIVVKEFGQQTQEVAMDDVATMDTVAVESEVVKESGLVIVGLVQEGYVIAS